MHGFLGLTVFSWFFMLSLGESPIKVNGTTRNSSGILHSTGKSWRKSRLAKIKPYCPVSGNVAVDKNWMRRQSQILTLLNSIQNCVTLPPSNFTILSHLKEYGNPVTLQKYVDGGFHDVQKLFDIFWHNWNNSEVIYNTGMNLLENDINPVEFYYGLASVAVNKGHRVPPAYDVFPDGILGPSEDLVGIDDIKKDLSQKKSPGVDYYLEDPGLRSFYVSWFLYNPIWWKDGNYSGSKDRTGELFLYIVHQLYARYNAARISEQTLSEVKDWKFRAEDVFVNEMDSKLQDMVWRSGPQPNMSNPLDHVGNLILNLSPDGKSYFMELLNIAEKDWIGSPLNSFYSVLKYIETFTRGAQENLIVYENRYTEAGLGFDGVTLESFKVIQKSRNPAAWKDNTFYTKWNYRKYYVKKCDKTVTFEKRILDHSEFFYDLQIESLLDNKTSVSVDIFLSTKFNFDGRPVLPQDYRKHMIHQDHFEITLKTGKNKFRRSSKHSSLSSHGDRSYLRQTQQLLDAQAGYIQLSLPNRVRTHCGIPSNLIIPKGGLYHPRKFMLLAIITPTTPNSEPFTFCEGGGNGKPFGFPFDRGLESDNLLEELKNVKKIQIDGIMLREDEYSEDL